jgi:hypothetical protein
MQYKDTSPCRRRVLVCSLTKAVKLATCTYLQSAEASLFACSCFIAVVFLVVLDALQSCERPLAFAPVAVPPLPTDAAPVLVSLDVPPLPTEPAPVLVSLAAPLPELPFAVPELVPEPELPFEPELLLPLLSPELLPPLLEFAAIADVARPMENTDTASNFNMSFPPRDVCCLTDKQQPANHYVPRNFYKLFGTEHRGNS